MKIRVSRLALVATILSVALSHISAHAQDLLKQFPVKGTATKMTGKSGGSKAKKKGVPQAQVALKGVFPTVPAAQTKSALDAKNLAIAQKLIGKNALVVGTVTKVFVPSSGSIVLLNFAADYQTALVGAIKMQNFAKFPPLQNLTGKKVLLSGAIVSYRGKPEIELSKSGAIRLVK